MRSALLASLLAIVAIAGMAGPAAAADGSAAAPSGRLDRTSLHLTATYDVQASLTWASGGIRVTSVMHVVNSSGGPIEHLELNALPAAIGRMHLGTVRVDGAIAQQAHIRRQTIIVPLGRTLPAGSSTDVAVRYRATFSPNTYDYYFLFSQANNILSAYRWIPWISREVPVPAGKWHGDPFVTPNSPSVRVTLSSDVPLRFATSGHEISHHGNTHTFLAQDVRDFNFTAARDYHKLVGQSIDGHTTITIYTRSLDPHVILNWARKSIAAYEAKLGQYPWPTLTYGEGSGGVGMESPGLIWLPYHWSSSLLPYLVGHETAHEWFYAAVGNDQISNSFADEAMAEFMDRWLFSNFRGSRCSKARLDLTIYQYNASCYFEQLYIQGADFMNELRQDAANRGEGDAFWAALHAYWNAEKFQISSNKILLDTLHAYLGDWVLKRYHVRFPACTEEQLSGVDLLAYPAAARWLLGAASALIGVVLLFRAAGRMSASRSDARGLIRSVRLMFLSVAAFAAAAGWFLGSALPIVVALIIAVVDVVETTFMLAVTASRTEEEAADAATADTSAAEVANGARPDEGSRPEG